MSNIKKTIGESPLRGTPKQKINLIIGDGKIKSRHIGNKQVTLEKLADEVMEEFQERISSHEETGIYVSNVFGASTGVAISQKTITDKFNEVDAAIASIGSNSGGHNILPFDGFDSYPVFEDAISEQPYNLYIGDSPQPIQYAIVSFLSLTGNQRFYLKVGDTYHTTWVISTGTSSDSATDLRVISSSVWYNESRENKLFYNKSNKAIYAYDYATMGLIPITNIQVVEENAPEVDSISNPNNATKGSIIVDLEHDKLLTWNGNKWKALSGGGNVDIADLPNTLALENGVLYLKNTKEGSSTIISQVQLPVPEDGEDGQDGKSAYELAKQENPDVGTLQEWIASLNGTDGKSAYEVWKEKSGNENKTISDFYDSLRLTVKAVQTLPEGNDIDDNTIYVVPGNDIDVWEEKIHTENGWILLNRRTDDTLRGLNFTVREITGTNLLNPAVTVNGYLDNSGDVINPQMSYKTSAFIEIDDTESYTLMGSESGSIRFLCFYDSSKSYISGSKATNVNLIQPPYAEGAKYIRVSDTFTATQIGIFKGVNAEYEPYSREAHTLYETENTFEQKDTNEILTKGDVDDTISELKTLAESLDSIDLENLKGIESLIDFNEEVSTNLLNPANSEVGYIASYNGSVNGTSGFETSDYIPVVGGETYTFVNIGWMTFYNGTTPIYPDSESYYNYYATQDPRTVVGIFTWTAPNTATTVRVGTKGGYLTTQSGIFHTSNYSQDDYEPYYHTKRLEYLGDKEGSGNDSIIATKNNDNFTVTDGKVSVNCTFDKTPNDIYGSSHCFNFLGASWAGISHGNYDDVAPMHMRGTTLGANHNYGQYIVKFTTNSFSDADIGGIISWVVNNVTFEGVIMRIVSSNTIVITNIQTSEYDYVTIRKPEGVVTYNNRGLAIAQKLDGQGNLVDDVTPTYVFPSLGDVSHKIMVDGIEVDGEDMSQINGNTIDFCESYELMNIKDVQDTLIDTQGDYAGDSIMHVDNIYRFCKDMTVLVISNYVFPIINDRLKDIMFNQAARINGGDNNHPVTQVTYYVPASSTVFATPTQYNLSDSTNFTPVEGKTISRAMQIYNDAIFVLGILPVGVGANLPSYTSMPLSISNTGKIYPHPVDKTHLNSVGVSTTVGESYSAVMYRKYLKVSEQEQGRICMYRIDYDNVAYIYIDYTESMLDHVELNDTSLNGKTIEVVEQMNAELKTTIYNDGFFVLAEPVTGKSSYCIVKIKL